MGKIQPDNFCRVCLYSEINENNESDTNTEITNKDLELMDNKDTQYKEKPDPERMAVLRSLPIEVKDQITGEEAHAFLYNEELPDSLLEKLKDYLVPE